VNTGSVLKALLHRSKRRTAASAAMPDIERKESPQVTVAPPAKFPSQPDCNQSNSKTLSFLEEETPRGG